MLKKTIVLNKDARFHVRPVARIVEKAMQFESLICLSTETYLADCKSALSLMRIGRPTSGIVEIITEGSDELDAMNEIEYTIKNMHWR